MVGIRNSGMNWESVMGNLRIRNEPRLKENLKCIFVFFLEKVALQITCMNFRQFSAGGLSQLKKNAGKCGKYKK